MHRTRGIVLGVMAASLVASGCFGPFNLTRRLYKWNAEVGDRWEKELVFLLLTVIPVYGAATFADAIVLNSMEFWTGKNPVDPPSMKKSEGPAMRRIVRGSDEARLSRVDGLDSRTVTLELLRDGTVSRTLRFEHRTGEPTVATDADGRLIMSAQTLADGQIVLTDASGRQVAAYSSQHVEEFVDSASR
jgi:hypothetical protein